MGTGNLKIENVAESPPLLLQTAIRKASILAKPELGTKRVCPDTGRKFYDLNQDPIVSPYTGKTFPLSFFDDTAPNKVIEKEEVEEVAEVDSENPNVEVVSLEDADDEASGGKDDNLPDIDEDDSDVELDEDDEDDDDVSDIIGGHSDDEEDT